MNENHSPNPTNMVTSVKRRIRFMCVPPAPPRHETLDAIYRAAVSAGNEAVVRRGSRLSRLTTPQRFAVGGISISTVAAFSLVGSGFERE